MNLTFHSPVLITKDLEILRNFYEKVLQLEVELDFGACIIFKDGFSLWQLNEDLQIAKKLGYTHHQQGNKNLELSFETENFNDVLTTLEVHAPKLLHETHEEDWGQRTIRFFDPEDNLIEIGESIPAFVRRLHAEGLNIDDVAEKTGVPKELVLQYLKK